MKLIIVIGCLLVSIKGFTSNELTPHQLQLLVELNTDSISENSKVYQVKFKRGKLIVLTVFTGFLGGHRIYLGTHQRTPIIYSVTLGGLFILPLIDLVHIIFTKDINKFDNKSQIIMWRDE